MMHYAAVDECMTANTTIMINVGYWMRPQL
jgi:hypothetical protein